MKKFLTVLLALSVVFTYTVGSAFAYTYKESTSAAESQAEFSKFLDETTAKLSYDGDGKVTNANDLSSLTYVDGWLSKDAITKTIENYESEYLAKIGEASAKWDDVWKSLIENEKEVYKRILGTKDGEYSAWKEQASIEIAAALKALEVDLSVYSNEDAKKIQDKIDEQTPILENAIKTINAKIVDSEVSQADITAVKNVSAAIEAELKKYDTTTDKDEALATAKAAAEKALSDSSIAFDELADTYFENPATAEDAARKATYADDFDKMVAFYEDLIAAAEKVAEYDDIAVEVAETFDSINAFYTDLAVLKQGDLLVNYANTNADVLKAVRNSDGTYKYDPIDVEKALADALENIAKAVYAGVKENKTDGLTIALATLDVAEGDYTLQEYKEDAIEKFTTNYKEDSKDYEFDLNEWSADRKDKVEALQDEYADKILVSTVVADIDDLAEEAMTAIDGILRDNEIATLEGRVVARLGVLGYTPNGILENYFNAVVGSANYTATTKAEAVAAAVKVFQDAVIAKEDRDITITEINAVIAENRDAALAKLTDVKTKAELKEMSDALVVQFAALPKTVTLAEKDTVLAAQAAFDAYLAIPGTKKTDVNNSYLLKNAMTSLMNAEVKAVRDAIRALPKTVTVADAEAIAAAEAAYDALEETYGAYDNETGAKEFNYFGTTAIQSKVTNSSVLLDTVTGAKVKLEKAKVADAVDKISALGATPTKEAVEAARAAYDALTLESKLKFNDEVYAALLKAEDAVKAIAIAEVESLKIVTSTKLYTKSNKIRVNWKVKDGDASAITGYQVYKSTKAQTGYKFMGKTTKSYMDNKKNLKKGQRYFYKVRAYVDVDGERYYSDWSNKGNRIYK